MRWVFLVASSTIFLLTSVRALAFDTMVGIQGRAVIYNTCKNDHKIKGGGGAYFGLGEYDYSTGEGYTIGYEMFGMQSSLSCLNLGVRGGDEQIDDSVDLGKLFTTDHSFMFMRFFRTYFYGAKFGDSDLSAKNGTFFPKGFNYGWHGGIFAGLSLADTNGRPKPSGPLGLILDRMSIIVGYDFYKFHKRGCITKSECSSSAYVADEVSAQYITLGGLIDMI